MMWVLGGSGIGFRGSGRGGGGEGMGNDSVLVKFGEKRKGRRRGEKPGRRNMGRSLGSY